MRTARMTIGVFFLMTCFFAAASAQGHLVQNARLFDLAQDKSDGALPVAPGQIVSSGNEVIIAQTLGNNDSTSSTVRYAGIFNIGTTDGKPLLFDYPNGLFNSHINFWLDGELFSNELSVLTSLSPLPLAAAPHVLPSGAIVCQYEQAGVVIEQRFTPEQYSDTTGAILIQYFISNNSAIAHEVGVLLRFDTKLGAQDNAPFLTNFGYSDIEAVFEQDSVPDFFLAFENRPGEPGLVAQGSLVGLKATRPDFFAIGDWNNLRRARWDYTAAPVKYNDSAAMLRWDPQLLEPGQTRTVGTYLGVGEVTTARGDLTLIATAPGRLSVEENSLAPNPFSLNVIIVNNSGATAESLLAEIELPEFLELAAGELPIKTPLHATLPPQSITNLSWRVQAHCPGIDAAVNMKVKVSAANVTGNEVERGIGIPSCNTSGFAVSVQEPNQTIFAGQQAAFIVDVIPFGSFAEAVDLELWPLLPGSNYTFTPPRLFPGSFSRLAIETSADLLPGVYHFAVTGRSQNSVANDTIALQILGVLVDREPPFVTGHNPARAGLNVLPETAITVEIHDAGAGVDSTSIAMIVNGEIVKPVIAGDDAHALKIAYRPRQPFRYNEVVQVAIRAADLAVPPNQMPEERYSFAIVEDFAPPFLTDSQPPRNAERASPDTEVSFHLRDDLAGVEAASIILKINGVAVSPTLTGTERDLTVRYVPPQPFALNDTVFVAVTATDRALPPNVMPEEKYFFVVQAPVYDLVAAGLKPLDKLQAGIAGRVEGEIRNELDEIFTSVRVQFFADGALKKDTALVALASGEVVRTTFSVRFVEPGAHRVEMQVDVDNAVPEISEGNNRQELLVEILPAPPREFFVQPNPFTPNQDGFNDVAEFNYAGLSLEQATLSIFDGEGVTVLSVDDLRAGVFRWDGRDRHGRELPPGIYLYALRDRGNNVAHGYIVLAR